MTDRPRVDILNFSFYDRDGARVLAGGAERYVLELARVIDAIGAQPQIIQNSSAPWTSMNMERWLTPTGSSPRFIPLVFFAISSALSSVSSSATSGFGSFWYSAQNAASP